jgi:small acid-soluble spore protein H (minor)
VPKRTKKGGNTRNGSHACKTIAESGKIVSVTYEGQQVIILQHVDEEQEMARIYMKNHPEREMEVPVRLLQEE